MCRQQDLPAAHLWAALAQLCLLVAARCELLEQPLLAPVSEADLQQPVELDRQLQGFQPLQAVHRRADFARPAAADEVSWPGELTSQGLGGSAVGGRSV